MGKYLDGSTRQLTDLRIPPSKDDPRPKFELGDVPSTYPGYGDAPPFRCLRWHPVSGEEVCATTLEQLARFDDEGYLKFPIQAAPKTAVEDVAAELAALTDDERQLVFEAQRQARLSSIQAKLAKLSNAELESVSVPVKRGPGRPRKLDA